MARHLEARAEHLRLGRARAKPKHSLSKVRGRAGHVAADKGEALEMLWQSRQAVWQAGWTPTAASRALLAAHGRRQ
eukprot:11629171-Alexandrium_andersonii.AAC.1